MDKLPLEAQRNDGALGVDSKTEAYINRVNSLNDIYNPADPPRILYHYTDFAGLKGILMNHRIWATYNRVLNDASEQRHAEGVIRQELTRLLIEKSGSCSGLPVSLFPDHRVFVACFCEVDNLLSMWRAYAGSGSGYCLGFDYSGLRGLWWPEPKVSQSHPLLARAHYGSATLDSIKAYLAAIISGAPDSGSDLEDMAMRLSPFLSSMIKHAAFSEEKEWRIIALDPPAENLEFRPGLANIRPYIELSWLNCGKPRGKLPLVSVTIGPTVRSEDNPEEVVGWMVQRYGYTDIAIKCSDVPFRL